MSITLLSNSGKQAGAISSSAGIGVALASDQVVVTAVGDSGGNLKLVTWKVSSDGKSITRMGDSGQQAGTVSLLDMAGAANNRFVTAVRAANGKLLLIAWQVNTGTGAVTRLSDSGNAEGVISLVTMTQSPLGDGRVLIAVRDGGGNLVVKNWEVTSNGTLNRVGDTALQGQPAGAISLVAIEQAGSGKIVTAVRDSAGNLKLIAWEVLSSGGIKRLGDSGQQGEAVSLVDMGAGEGYLVTAIRDSGGNLKLISWKISPDGKTVTRIADSGQSAGGIDRLSCVSLPKAGLLFEPDPSRIVTSVRTKVGSLKLIVWQVGSNGALTRIEDFDETGTISLVRMSPTITNVYLTAVRDSDGNLKLITWHFDRVQPEPLPNNLVAYDQSYFENTAQVISPGATAPKGRIVLALGEPRPTSGYVARDLLDAAGTEFALTAPQTKVLYPCDLSTQKPATDNQLIRLQDGSLMGIKNGYVWSDLPSPPAWFNTVNLSGQTSQQARNAVFVFRSTDGVNWTLLSYIDSAIVENGDYGWPQGDGSGKYGVGGYDRTEIYQDPWTKNIYVTGHGDGGPYTENGLNVNNHAGVVFVSKDNGVNWNTLHKFVGQGKGGAPYVMTSTPDHPLVLLNVWGGVPTLYWLEKRASSLSGGKSVAVVEQGSPVNSADDAGIGDLRGAPPCIARIGTASSGRDRVWIAYKTTNASGRQVYKLCVATFAGGKDPTTELVTTIQAEPLSDRAACLGGFVQDDRIETQLANPDNLTMFYWVDAPPSTAANPNGLIVRFKMLCGVTGHFQSGYLSVTNGGKRAFDRVGIGDYLKGGYFEWNGKIHFFVQWRESTKLMGNVVSMTP